MSNAPKSKECITVFNIQKRPKHLNDIFLCIKVKKRYSKGVILQTVLCKNDVVLEWK